MRRKFSVLSMMLVMCVVTIPSAAVAGEKITLTEWSHSNPAYVTAAKTLAKRYENENPNVKIKIEVYPYDTMVQKIIIGMATGKVPEIITAWGEQAAQYRSAGQVIPLSPAVMSNSEFERYFHKAALGGIQAEGKFYALPFNLAVDTGFIENAAMFREAGLGTHFENWNEFIAAAKKLRKYDAEGNFKRIGLTYIANPQVFMMGTFDFIKQLGGDLWLEDGEHLDLTSPEAIKAMEVVTGLTTEHHLTSPEFEGGVRRHIELFFTGQAAMDWVGPWAVAVGWHEYPKVKVNYIMGPSLTDRPRYTFIGSGGGWCLVVSKAAEHKNAACQYIKFVTRKENMRTWNKLTGTIPSLKALDYDPELLKEYPHYKNIFPILDSLYWAGPIQNFQRLSDLFEEYLMTVLYGKTTVEEIAPTLQKDVNTVIDEYLTLEK